MYAIIMTGGKQYKVAEGDEVFIEKIDGMPGDSVTFDQVLAVNDDSEMKAGGAVSSAKVTGEIVKQGKDKKINIFKYKPKKGYSRRKGHRQPHTRVKITGIAL